MNYFILGFAILVLGLVVSIRLTLRRIKIVKEMYVTSIDASGKVISGPTLIDRPVPTMNQERGLDWLEPQVTRLLESNASRTTLLIMFKRSLCSVLLQKKAADPMLILSLPAGERGKREKSIREFFDKRQLRVDQRNLPESGPMANAVTVFTCPLTAECRGIVDLVKDLSCEAFGARANDKFSFYYMEGSV